MIKQTLFSIINRFLLSHKTTLLNTKIEKVKINKLSMITSSENVFLCDIEQEQKYVRLIRKHTKLYDYLHETIDLFFDFSDFNECQKQFRKKAHDDLENRTNYKLALKTEKTCQRYVKEVASGTFNKPELFGFPSLQSDLFAPNICSFILFIRGELVLYRANKGIRRNRPQTFSANLQIATHEFAKLLGIDKLIPAVAVYEVQFKQYCFLATVMNASPGIPANSVEMCRRKHITSCFIQCISNLDYFDAICYQTDHKQRNYNVVLQSSGKIEAISAFDNDAPLTFAPFLFFPKRVSLINNYQPVYRRKVIQRNFIDKSFSDVLLSLKKKTVCNLLVKYISVLQVNAVWFRIVKLCRCLKRYQQNKPDFFIDFNDDRISIEPFINDYSIKASGDYLSSYLTNDEKKMYAHIKI